MNPKIFILIGWGDTKAFITEVFGYFNIRKKSQNSKGIKKLGIESSIPSFSFIVV